METAKSGHLVPLATGRFRAVQQFAESGQRAAFVPVRTSIGVPRFIDHADAWPFVTELAPWGLKGIENKAEFEARYLERLAKQGVECIASRFQAIYADYAPHPLLLLCFEDVRREWCHRRMFAAWWEAQTGQAVEEVLPHALGQRSE